MYLADGLGKVYACMISDDMINAGGRSDEAESVIAYHFVTIRGQRDKRKPVSYCVHKVKSDTSRKHMQSCLLPILYVG